MTCAICGHPMKEFSRSRVLPDCIIWADGSGYLPPEMFVDEGCPGGPSELRGRFYCGCKAWWERWGWDRWIQPTLRRFP